MSNDVDLFQPLHEKIETVRRYGKGAEQLTVRISSELRTALKRLAKKERIKEGAMHRALLEWAIEVYTQSSQGSDVSDEQLVRSEQLEILEQISLLGDELAKLRGQVELIQLIDNCSTCPVRSEFVSLKAMFQAFIEQEQSEDARKYSDGPLLNGIRGLE